MLEAAAPQPVAYAVVSNPGDPPPPDCAGSCCTDGDRVVIDNPWFDAGAVPARLASWGEVKIRYR